MSGNSFGTLFVVTTSGESHGPALMAIVDGCPAGLALNEADLQREIRRRQSGRSRFTSQRKESDQIKILSGLFEGVTTGTPIGLLIENQDQRSRDYEEIKHVFRPGHADYTYYKKYGIRDYRGGGRSSARETVMRVAAGAIAKKFLAEKVGINIYGYVSQIGSLCAEQFDKSFIETNPFFFPDKTKVAQLETLLTQVRREGDSLGAKVCVVATGMPAGLGEPVFSRAGAEIAKAMMSINAAKAVAIGDGFEVVSQRGTEHRDEMDESGFFSNHAGGMLGGISTGQDLVVSVAFKPTASLTTPGRTVDVHNQPTEIVTKGRHDPCVGIRAVPIAEAMLALVLMDLYLQQQARRQ